MSDRLFTRLHRKLRLLVGRAVLNLVNDATGCQQVQVTALDGEVRDLLERMQEFGFSSVPLPGCDAVVVAVMGSRDGMVVVGTNDPRYRPTGLNGGESMQYNAFGDFVHLTADGTLHIKVRRVNLEATESITLNSPLTTAPSGDIADRNGSMQEMRDVHNVHTHNEHDGGTTAVPNQLMT